MKSMRREVVVIFSVHKVRWIFKKGGRGLEFTL